jgi:predicted ribosomally synthesized peptide with nif11-like leader
MEGKFDIKGFTPEQLNAALACKTPEELIALAKENGIELSSEEANRYLAQMSEVDVTLSDAEMKSIAGGTCDGYCIYNKW